MYVVELWSAGEYLRCGNHKTIFAQLHPNLKRNRETFSPICPATVVGYKIKFAKPPFTPCSPLVQIKTIWWSHASSHPSSISTSYVVPKASWPCRMSPCNSAFSLSNRESARFSAVYRLVAKCLPSSSSLGLACGLGHGFDLSSLSPMDCRTRALPKDVVEALFRWPFGVAILEAPGGANGDG